MGSVCGKEPGRRQLAVFQAVNHHVAVHQLHNLPDSDAENLIFILDLGQHLVGVEEDLGAVCDLGRLSGPLLIGHGKGAGDVGRQEHDQEGDRVASVKAQQGIAGGDKEKIEQQHAGKGGNQAAQPLGGTGGDQQHPQNIDHDDIGFAELQVLKQRPQGGGSGQGSGNDAAVPQQPVQAVAAGLFGAVAGVHIEIGNDMDIHFRHIGQQLLRQGGLAPMALDCDAAAAQHDFRDAGQPCKFGDLVGNVVAVDQLNIGPQLGGQLLIGLEAALVVLRGHGKIRGFDKQGRELTVEGPGHSGGGADDLGIGGGGGQAHQNVLVCGKAAAALQLLRQPLDPVGAAPQGNFPQGGQLLQGQGGEGAAGGLQALHQLAGLQIHQLHLVGLVEYIVRNPLPGGNPSDGGNRVVEGFNVADIDSGVDIDAVFQQLLHILIAPAVAAAGGVLVL